MACPALNFKVLFQICGAADDCISRTRAEGTDISRVTPELVNGLGIYAVKDLKDWLFFFLSRSDNLSHVIMPSDGLTSDGHNVFAQMIVAACGDSYYLREACSMKT